MACPGPLEVGGKAEELCETPLHAERFFQGAWEMGRADRALALCDTLLKDHSQSVDFLRLKVLSLRRLGELLRAERTLQILLGLDPEDEAGQLYRREPQETALISRSQALLQSLEKQAAEKAPLLQTGPFQRTLRSLMMALKNLMPADAIHYIVCRLWRKMPVSWRQACDRKHSPILRTLALMILAPGCKRSRPPSCMPCCFIKKGCGDWRDS